MSALIADTVRLRKGDWLIQSVTTHGEAVGFIRRHHYSRSAPNTSTYRHGLWRDDPAIRPLVADLLGVALWIPPTRAAAETVADDWQGVLSLSRFAVHPDAPPNAASFLLGGSMRLIDRGRWPVLLTYADTNQGHSGGIYKATNWECLGEVPAGDVWLSPTGEQRGRKRGGKTLVRTQMVAAGYEQVPAAPKIKFVHRVYGHRRVPASVPARIVGSISDG